MWWIEFKAGTNIKRIWDRVVPDAMKGNRFLAITYHNIGGKLYPNLSLLPLHSEAKRGPNTTIHGVDIYLPPDVRGLHDIHGKLWIECKATNYLRINFPSKNKKKRRRRK